MFLRLGSLTKSCLSPVVKQNVSSGIGFTNSLPNMRPPPCQLMVSRQTSSYNDPPAEALWNTMAGVSQQGKKRGRARNLLKQKNLNRGQLSGFGKAKIVWPGLTTKVLGGIGKEETVKNIEPMEDRMYDDYMENLEELRAKSSVKKGFNRIQHPLDRGWTSKKALGRRFGAPQSLNKDVSFDNFETILLEFKTVFHMTGTMGRTRRNSILMVTGNRNGAIGYTVSSGKYGGNIQAMRRAKNKAGLRLVNVERYEDRTVYHDFFTQFGKTRIFVQQQPPGFGLRCHRGIKAICDLVGIKDMYAKVEGSLNMQHIVKAFILGLLRQRTHQALADEKQLYLVEMRKENDYFPKVVATPSNGIVRTEEEIGHNEILDFEMISFEGHLPQWLPGQPSGPAVVHSHEGTPGFELRKRKNWVNRDNHKVRMRMRVENGPEWGAVRSHLYPKYPECVERNWKELTRLAREAKKGED